MISTEASQLLSDVVGRWKRHGIARAAAAKAEIDRVERDYGVCLPKDLAGLFLLADGMADGDADDLTIRFWPVGELKRATDELPEADHREHANLFVFADYSLWAHAYAIRLTNSEEAGAIAIVGGPHPIQISSSFAQFLENYMHHSDRLFSPA